MQRGRALRPPPPASPPLKTFTILGATSRMIDASVAAQLHLRYVSGLIVYSFAFNSSSIGASARLLRRLRALSLSSGAVVCAAVGHGGPSPSSSACSGGSSDGTPSARTRATRPQSPRAGPYLLSPLSFRRLIRPLLVLAGAGDASEPRRVNGGRLRPAAAGIDARGGADTPLSHRGACAAERARESVAGGRTPRRARTCECYRVCML